MRDRRTSISRRYFGFVGFEPDGVVLPGVGVELVPGGVGVEVAAPGFGASDFGVSVGVGVFDGGVDGVPGAGVVVGAGVELVDFGCVELVVADGLELGAGSVVAPVAGGGVVPGAAPAGGGVEAFTMSETDVFFFIT